MTTNKSPKQYLVRHHDGTQSGTFDTEALKSLAANGRIESEDAISEAGSDRWVKAYKVQGLDIDQSVGIKENQPQWMYKLERAEIGPVNTSVLSNILVDSDKGHEHLVRSDLPPKT